MTDMTRQFFKRSISLLCSFLLVAALVLGSDVGLTQVQAEDGYTITFVASGTHTIEVQNGHLTLDGQIVEIRDGNNQSIGTASMSGAEGKITVSDGTAGELNFGGNAFSLYNTDGHTAVSAGTRVTASMVLSVEDYADQGPDNNNPPAGVGKYNVHIDQRIEGFVGKVWISFFDVNDAIIGDPYEYEGNVGGQTIPADATHLVIEFAGTDAAYKAECLRNFKNGWCEVTRDSVRHDFDVFDQIRKDEEHVFTLSSASQIWTGREWEDGMDIDPTTDSLNFRFEFDDTRNVSWSYDPSAPADQYVQHCHIYKLAGDDPSTIIEGTDFNLHIGDAFYFLLVPDYGYQVTGLKVNGWIDIAPMNNIGVFKFDMVDSNFHFNAVVSPSNDITDTSKAGAVAGVTIGNGGNATANGGNLRVTVADAATPDGATNLVQGTVLSTVDIDVDNIVSKGNGTYWSSDVTEIEKPIDVGLQLDPAATPDGTYVVVKEHNGKYSEIAATYDPSTGVLTFPSNEFSTFTIVRKENQTAEKTSADNSEAGATAPTLASVANKPYETGKLYADTSSTPDASAIHAGSGVTIRSVSRLTNESALSQLAEEVNNLYLKTKAVGIKSTGSFAMELDASGQGFVTFDVGTTGTAAAVVSHFHNNRWTRQIVDVIDGSAKAYFSDFSPVYITVYEGVTANDLRNAGITETEFKTTSPKTGERSLPILFAALLAGIAALVLLRSEHKNEKRDE